jgi:glycosyltransferase involved in cell wall biosynthesis
MVPTTLKKHRRGEGMSRFIVFTQAYNAEKTLARTIESILSQTCGDLVHYVVNNGSTDGTGGIICKYAEKDSRIVALANAKNRVWGPRGIFGFLEDHDDGCYFCVLDADDEYKPDFLEKMYAFVAKHNLEVAACGRDNIDAVSGAFYPPTVPEQDMILAGETFGTFFPYYHYYMRSWWCKLYSLAILREWRQAKMPWDEIRYGFDTLFCQAAFRRAKRAGVLAESLHKYYISPESRSYTFDEMRLKSNRVLFNVGKDFLMEKVGTISPLNEYYLYVTFLGSVKETLQVVMQAEMPVEEKLAHVRFLQAELDEIQSFMKTVNVEELQGLYSERA